MSIVAHRLALRGAVHLALLSAVSLGGCVAGSEDVATTSSPVVAGTPVPAANSGYVAIAGTPFPVDGGIGREGCSGALLANDWVLTAEHCLDLPQDVAAPENVSLMMGSTAVSAREVLHWPDGDVALVRTDAPMPMNGTTIGHQQRLYWSTADELRGTWLRCSGYGAFDLAGSGAGVLRQAYLQADISWGTFLVRRNASGQQLFKGDSGGPCERVALPHAHIAGVTSVGWPSSGDTEIISTNRFRDWVGISRATHELVAIHSGKCLRPTTPTATGTELVGQTSCDLGASQRWRLVPTYGGKFQIRSVASGRCLGLATSGSVWPSVAACDVESTLQRWTLNHRGGGVFEIVSDGGGRCLEIGGASTEEGAALRHADCTGLSNQRFLTNSFLPPGWHEIAPLSSQIRQCANARHGDQEQGAPVTQWTCSGLENQQFALTPLKPDTRDHAICAEHSGQCLVPVAVPAGTVAPLFPVVQKVLIDAPAYRWRAHFTGRGFRLRSSPIPTVCLSVDPAAIWSNGATIGYAPCDEVDHQRFSIR